MQLQTAAGVCRWVDTALYYSYACTAKYSAIYNIHASAKKFSVKQVQWWGLSAYMRRVHLLITLSLLLLLHWLLLLLLLYIAVQCSVKQLQRIHAARALVIESPASPTLQCIPHANNPLDIHFKPPSFQFFSKSKVVPLEFWPNRINLSLSVWNDSSYLWSFNIFFGFANFTSAMQTSRPSTEEESVFKLLLLW